MTKYKFQPRTAAQWELYAAMEGSAGAALRMNRAMVRALNCDDDEEAWAVMREAMEIDSDFGATDTEPVWIVQYEFRHLTPEHRAEVLTLRKEIDRVVRGVLSDGVEQGDFDVDDISGTALALLSLAVDVARWYSPEIRRTPADIARTNGELAVRLVARR